MLQVLNLKNCSNLNQILASLISLLLHLSLGVCEAFSAVFIPQLQASDSEIKIDENDASWIASIPCIAMPVVVVFVGIMMDVYGRKRVIQLAFIPLTIGWAIIAIAPSVVTICIGRTLTGIAIGMDPVVTTYIAEINIPKLRAILLSLTGPTMIVGNLMSYLLGHYLYWRLTASIMSIFSGLCFLTIFLIPESPTWCVFKERIQQATASLEWLRHDKEQVNAELDELLHAKYSKVPDDKGESFARKMIRTKAWKPFLILSTYFLLQQLCGNFIIVYYGVNFYDALGTPVDGFYGCFVYLALSLVTAFVFTSIVELFDRRTLSVVPSIGIFLAYFSVCIYEFVYENEPNKPMYWFPLICMWSSVVFYVLGLGSTLWLMSGELFPMEVRGVMSGLLWLTVYIYIFICIKLYPLLVPIIKIYGVLAIFTAGAFVSILFGFFTLPETRGKSLIEIENMW